MASEVKLPRLGQGMESGTIVRWLKSEGEPVEKGEPLYELDTEKVTQEVEADVAGVLLKIAVETGEVPVGRTIAVIGEEGEDVPVEEGPEPEAEEKEPARTPEPESEPKPEPARADGRVKVSPLARRIARERGIDLSSLEGTGPEGRIVAEDLERAEAPPAGAAPRPSSGDVERVELTKIRRTIARRLTEAWQIPVFHLQASADMTSVQRVVEGLRKREVKATVTDVLVKACAVALMRHREVNGQWTDDAILLHPTANIGVAVAAPQGLVVPVIHAAETLGLEEITRARADVVSRAREGKLRQEDFEGGTFTISNLGMFKVERFTAVLNPPQSAIVATGAIEDRVVAVGGEPAVRPVMTFVGTFDHRAVDGAPAAGFLQTLKELLEEPGLML